MIRVALAADHSKTAGCARYPKRWSADCAQCTWIKRGRVSVMSDLNNIIQLYWLNVPTSQLVIHG
jgi:hypothetical protein